TAVPGTLVNRYRLYSPVTLEHLFTTDLNEYTVLGTSPAWIQEGQASQMHIGPANVGGVEAVPYYRLYNVFSRTHHWTTDRNEYFTLRGFTGTYVAEGVDGYIFKTQVTGTTPWYRLFLPGFAIHTWTADLNERDTLVNQRGWVEEQREYVFPPLPGSTGSTLATVQASLVGSQSAAAAASSVVTPPSSTTTVPVRVSGDVNADGRGDVIWRQTQTGDVAVWLMDGGVVTQGPVVAAGVPLAWQIAI